MQKWIIFTIILIIVVIGVFIAFNVEIETEYVPEAEVEETEMRNTIVTLYFANKTNGEIAKENRMLDSKELLKNPYKALIEMLIAGPESTNYEKVIPENTSLIDITFENGTVLLNFSKEFKENIENEKIQRNKLAISKTLKELTEVMNVKIFIEGEEIE